MVLETITTGSTLLDILDSYLGNFEPEPPPPREAKGMSPLPLSSKADPGSIFGCPRKVKSILHVF